MEIQEKRDAQLKKLDKIDVRKLTVQEKIQNKILLDKKIDELTGTKSIEGNRIKLLLDGAEAFERIKERINNAKESIFIDVYLFYDDPKGHEIADMLIKKANEGLDVRVIIDGPGNLSHGKIIDKLKNSKVQFYKYRGSFHNPITNRGQVGNHRKLYIFDKKVAMTGGINLGEKYLKEGKWHDLLVEVEGPIMSDTIKDFNKKWSFTTGKPLEWAPPPSYYKKFDNNNFKEGNLEFDSTAKIRLITTSPSEKKKDIRTWMLEAINNAKERVYIQDPYFNDPDIIQALKNAINRGVKVQIILPNANDVHIMKHIGSYVADELYAEGADLYIYNTSGKESFNHLKATIVDDLVSVGSANKDMRAMNTNEEINYVIDDKKFTNDFIKRVWEPDIKNSTKFKPVPDNVLRRIVKLGFSKIPSMF
jgi:cardiolipin synthase